MLLKCAPLLLPINLASETLSVADALRGNITAELLILELEEQFITGITTH